MNVVRWRGSRDEFEERARQLLPGDSTNIAIENKLYYELAGVARAQGSSLSAVVHQALHEYLRNREDLV